MIDQFFTPSKIAESSIFGLRTKGINIIADFAIGDGSLVKAVKFEPKKIIGLDIDQNVIKKIKKNHPKWILRSGDFINPNKTVKKWLYQWEKKIDLILLNPPFSCRGGAFVSVMFEDNEVRCRTALAFVLNALHYLSPKGKLIAILPLSCIKSDSDLRIFELLKNNWEIKIGAKFGRNTFKGCNPNSVVISLKRKWKKVNNPVELSALRPQISHVEILRGNIPMYTAKDSGIYPVIHTTNLQQNFLDKRGMKKISKSSRFVQGVFVCVQRVGLPDRAKIVLVATRKKYVLSDCVIAIKGSTIEDTKKLYQLLSQNWEIFSQMYESTCAPYITISQLQNFLFTIDIRAEIVSAFSDTNRIQQTGVTTKNSPENHDAKAA